jgi:hypothetical protein
MGQAGGGGGEGKVGLENLWEKAKRVNNFVSKDLKVCKFFDFQYLL